MLFFFTSLTELIGMAVCVWLALYLLTRGLPSPTTLRATLALLVLGAGLLTSYINMHAPSPSLVGWWVGWLTISLTLWFNLTHTFLPTPIQKRWRALALGVYAFNAVKIGLLVFLHYADQGSPQAATEIVPLGLTLFGLFDLLTVTMTALAILYNLRVSVQYGVGLTFRSMSLAFVLGVGSVIYGMLAIVFPGLPRVGQTGLMTLAVITFSYTVAAHQSLIERSVTLQDFPVSALMMFGLVGMYTLAGWRLNLPPVTLALLIVFTICTHSAFGVVRQFLDRLLYRRESALRQQLRQLAHEVGGEDLLPAQLQQGLLAWCQALAVTGGFIAARREAQLMVVASWHSLPLHTVIGLTEVQSDEVHPPVSPALAQRVAWLAPARSPHEIVALVGVGPRQNKARYTGADLELLADIAEWAGRIVQAQAQENERRQQLLQMVAESQTLPPVEALQVEALQMEEELAAPEHTPPPEFVQPVEEGLRHLSDYATLGSSVLAAPLKASGLNHIERGKAVRAELIHAIEALKPNGPRPPGIPPREWYAYIILHDAYIEEAPNREIMARLYISEGTFNRQRRKALQAVARAMQEIMRREPRAFRTVAQIQPLGAE